MKREGEISSKRRGSGKACGYLIIKAKTSRSGKDQTLSDRHGGHISITKQRASAPMNRDGAESVQ